MWDDFDNAYLMDDKYILVHTAIMGKAGRIRDKGNERISWGGNCAKNFIPEINLSCFAIAPKSKWEKSMKRVKENNWVIYSDGSKNEEGRVGSGRVAHGGKIQGNVGLGNLGTVWDR